MIHVRVCLVVTLSLLLCWTAAADPSLLGLSGLLYSPSADVLPEGAWNIGMNSSELEDFDIFNYYGNFGISSDTEIGVLLQRNAHTWRSESDSDKGANLQDETFLGVKRAFTLPEGGKPGISAGVFDLTDEVQTTVYVVASWELGREVGVVDGKSLNLLNLHAGFGSGQLEDLFFGARARLGKQIELMGEHVSNEWNVGARIHPIAGLTVDAGLIDMSDVAVNVSYSQPL